MPGISWTLKRLIVKRRPTLMPASWQLRMPSRAAPKAPGHAPEAVVDLLHAVQADAHVGQADVLERSGDGRA